MADIVFNIAKGRVAHYATLPAANDSLVAVVLNSSGLAVDSIVRDLDTLSQVLGSATEHTSLTRKTLTGVTVTVDDATDRVVADANDLVWTLVSAGASTGALVICYKPDTNSLDSALIPLVKLDFALTSPNGEVTFAFHETNGFYRAT